MTGRTSFAAPSCAEIASTIATFCLRHCGGAVAPMIPGSDSTADSIRLSASGVAFPSTRISNGL